MEILNYIDILLIAFIIIIAVVILARKGQIALLRELIEVLSDGIDTADLYEHLPRLTRLLVSGKTVDRMANERKEHESDKTHEP